MKTEAQKLGFHAEVEKQLAAGSNDAADLVLRRGQLEIAVEITITTGVDHEFANVQKCLAAGFKRVAVVATGRKHLDEIAAAVQGGLGSAMAVNVSYHTPDEFLAELQALAKTVEEPPTVRADGQDRQDARLRDHPEFPETVAGGTALEPAGHP